MSSRKAEDVRPAVLNWMLNKWEKGATGNFTNNGRSFLTVTMRKYLNLIDVHFAHGYTSYYFGFTYEEVGLTFKMPDDYIEPPHIHGIKLTPGMTIDIQWYGGSYREDIGTFRKMSDASTIIYTSNAPDSGGCYWDYNADLDRIRPNALSLTAEQLWDVLYGDNVDDRPLYLQREWRHRQIDCICPHEIKTGHTRIGEGPWHCNICGKPDPNHDKYEIKVGAHEEG